MLRVNTCRIAHCTPSCARPAACRIVTADLSELRAVNVRAIRAARASAAAAGLADGRGYDMLAVPQVGPQRLFGLCVYDAQR
jgi:hypothetical protein